MMSGISSRKSDHVRITLEEDVEMGGTGLDCVRFVHRALPELNAGEIDTGVEIMGKCLDIPLMISAMTGGYEGAKRLNVALATAAQENGMAFGLGSMRAMIEHPSMSDTYCIRDVAPDVLIFGNIGLPQLLARKFDPILDAMEDVDADAVAVHLNALHEATQPEGDSIFSGGLAAIEDFSSSCSLPVVVKETGGGISKEVADSLLKVGIQWIDVGGYGGTSFAAVERHRSSGPGAILAESLSSWGIPTAASVAEVVQTEGLRTIASGGIRDGLDAAKCLSLGAECAGMASPFLKALEEGKDRLAVFIELLRRQITSAMLLTGSENVGELRRSDLVLGGWLRNWLEDRGIDPASFSNRSTSEGS